MNAVASEHPTMPTPRVLALVEWYLPGERAGGPVRSIDALVHRLAGQVCFEVVTRDRDLGERAPYAGIETGVWLAGRLARCRYLERRDEGLFAMLRLLRRTPYDLFYLNTLYSPAFALYPLFLHRLGLLRRRRVVLAPRGQLDPGALGIHRIRKRLYLSGIRALGLLDDIEWHATSPVEEANIRRFVGDAIVHVARNLRRPTVVPISTPSPIGTARVVFLSRISRMKNLDVALRIVGQSTANIVFDIYGQLEDRDLWNECRQLIATLPENVTCTYRGVVPHNDVGEVLAQYDLLLLPTRGENFGHVIGEALEAGCLALVSDRTPWRNLRADGAGWDLPLADEAAFTAAIDEYAGLDEAERVRRRRCAQACVDRRDQDETQVLAYLRLLAGAPGR